MPNQDDIAKPNQAGSRVREPNEAFRNLVRENQPYAYALAFRFLGNAADAEDAVQESFLRVWKHLTEYDPERKFTTWLYRIVANVCFDALKSKKRKGKTGQFPLNGALTEIADQDADLARDLDEKEAVRLIHRFARELPSKQRMVFILRDLQDLSIDETAGVMRMTKASVKNNLIHARKFLRGKMEEQYKTGQ